MGGILSFTDEFLYTYRKNHQNASAGLYRRRRSMSTCILFINFKLKVAEAHSRGLDTTAKFDTASLKRISEELKKPYRTGTDALG
jgi:peptidyl-prolyl cis-trans isomerase SurA